MDKQETVSATTSANTVIKHILNFDDETKTTLMNISQYTALAIIPVAMMQNISERVFPEYDASKGTMELLVEILGQSLMTMVSLFFVHRVITAVPTFSGTAMGDINLFSIIVVFLVTSFMFDGKVEKKFKAISNRMMDLWEGKSDDHKYDNSVPQTPQNGSVVSVSQPISRGGIPTHSPSRADHVNTPSVQTSATQMLSPPPPPPVQNQQQEQYINPPSEPSAYNDGGGGFASF